MVHTSGSFFFFNDTATTEIYTLSLHDALPISVDPALPRRGDKAPGAGNQQERPRAIEESSETARQTLALSDEIVRTARSEEHTSELQSPCNLVCRLLLEKKQSRAGALSGCPTD